MAGERSADNSSLSDLLKALLCLPADAEVYATPSFGP